MQSEHPDDMTLTYLAFPQLGVEVSPEWKLHVLSCRECMETILSLREMEEEGLLGVSQFKSNTSLTNALKGCEEYDSKSPMKTAAAAAIGVGLIPAYEPLSLDDDGDCEPSSETDADIQMPEDSSLSDTVALDPDIDIVPAADDIDFEDISLDDAAEASESIVDVLAELSNTVI